MGKLCPGSGASMDTAEEKLDVGTLTSDCGSEDVLATFIWLSSGGADVALLLRPRSKAAALRPRRVKGKFSGPIGCECCWISEGKRRFGGSHRRL